jgi:hypothetical protein
VRAAIFLVSVSACVGPAAPDVEVCRDLVHRLCLPAACPQVIPLFPSGLSCDAQLLANSGCDKDDFAFSIPTREQFLSCRVPLLHAGQSAETHPSCDDVAQSFEQCPDMVRLLSGMK